MDDQITGFDKLLLTLEKSGKNYDVEKIYDADIIYTLSNYATTVDLSTGNTYSTLLSSETYTKTLTEFDTGSNKGDGLLGKKYTWNRICSVEEFKTEVQNDTNDGFSDAELSGLNNSDFVFRFDETEYSSSTSLGSQVAKYYDVSNIGILRIHFLSEGKVYNLGCIGDLVGTDSTPDMEVTIGDNIQNSLEENPLLALILFVVILLLLINLIAPIKAIFSLIVTVISFLVSIIFGIIKLPFMILQKK